MSFVATRKRKYRVVGSEGNSSLNESLLGAMPQHTRVKSAEVAEYFQLPTTDCLEDPQEDQADEAVQDESESKGMVRKRSKKRIKRVWQISRDRIIKIDEDRRRVYFYDDAGKVQTMKLRSSRRGSPRVIRALKKWGKTATALLAAHATLLLCIVGVIIIIVIIL